MEIKWLKTALRNLNDEADYIAEDNPEAARQMVQRVFYAVNSLQDNPSQGRAGRIHSTRELVIPNTRYIIPYRVLPRLQRIEILRVFHTSRRRPSQW